MHHIKELKKLPPSIKKTETVKILRQVTRSASALGELKGSAKAIPGTAMLINLIVLQEAKDSSNVKTVFTTQDELFDILSVNGGLSPQIQEIINYRKAIFLGHKRLKQNNYISIKDIEDIQKIIVKNNKGIRDITPKTSDNSALLDLLSNMIEYSRIHKSELSPLIDLAILHYQFESIHPFYEGNARTGRVLAVLYLMANNLLDIPILFLTSYINENIEGYHNSLNKVSKTDEWEDWILYVLKGIETVSIKTIKKINLIKNLLDETARVTQKKAPEIYRKELVELLFEQPYIKIDSVIYSLGVERKAASRYLTKLEKIGVLKSQKVGREKIYLNTKLLETLKVY